MGKVATSPLPSRGAPPLHSGGGESEVAQLWAKWLHHPCRLGDPHRFRAGGKIRSGPQVASGQSGYITPTVSGIPTASKRGAKSKVAHLWAKSLRHPCRLGDPHRFRAGGKIRSGPQVGKVATSPLPSRGSPPLQSGGGKSEVAHLWAKWLRLLSRGSPPLQSGGQNQKWPTSRKWAKWLFHPCRLGDPHRFRAGGKIRSGPFVGKEATSPLPSWGSPWFQCGGEIRSGPLMGKVATSPLPSRGSPPLQSGVKNQKWPTSGQSGYITPAVLGNPPLQSGVKNQKWPTYGQSGYITPAVSGSPTAAERGGNQKWPTSGQSGYFTPAVSGIPTLAERGGK